MNRPCLAIARLRERRGRKAIAAAFSFGRSGRLVTTRDAGVMPPRPRGWEQVGLTQGAGLDENKTEARRTRMEMHGRTRGLRFKSHLPEELRPESGVVSSHGPGPTYPSGSRVCPLFSQSLLGCLPPYRRHVCMAQGGSQAGMMISGDGTGDGPATHETGAFSNPCLASSHGHAGGESSCIFWGEHMRRWLQRSRA